MLTLQQPSGMAKPLHPKLTVFKVLLPITALANILVKEDTMVAVAAVRLLKVVIPLRIVVDTGIIMGIPEVEDTVLVVHLHTHRQYLLLLDETNLQLRGGSVIVSAGMHLEWRRHKAFPRVLVSPRNRSRLWTVLLAAGAILGEGVGATGEVVEWEDHHPHHLRMRKKILEQRRGRESVTMIWTWLQRGMLN